MNMLQYIVSLLWHWQGFGAVPPPTPDLLALSIDSLSFEHHRQALGIGESNPRISWRYSTVDTPPVNWEQTSYELEITRRSGEPKVHRVHSNQSVLVPWPGNALGSADSAQVRVRSHGKLGQASTDWSAYFTVETGLLKKGDWQGAVPITVDAAVDSNGPRRPIYFRKSFEAANITRARLYITSLGLYEAQINGNRAGDHVLAPGWQSYNHRHVYNTYDVTDLISHSGNNVLGILVGEGWYLGRMGFGECCRNIYGDSMGPMALLVLTHNDGSTTSVRTDTSWLAATGPIIKSEIYNGEIYNATLQLGNWSMPGYDSSRWRGTVKVSPPKGRLVSPDAPPIRRLAELPPREIFKSASGKTVVDFGQNHVGWLRLTVDGPAGTEITMVHTEVMENGEVATRPLRTATATDTLILSGNGPIVWEPTFTFHGFRYVQIEGWPDETPLDAESIISVVVHTDMERTGYFECSHPLLSKFEENVVWSLRGNFLSIPTDCPQRDERLGWTGDIHAFGPTASFLYDTSGFLRSWHRDVWAEQQIDNTMIVPFVVPMIPSLSPPQPAAVWGDVAVGGVWNLFTFFGDKEMLREQYQSAKAWIDTGIPRDESTQLWARDSFQFGDWLDPLAPSEDAGAATTHKILVADAYLIRMTELLAKMSAVLGRSDDAERYTQQHRTLLHAFQHAWIDPSTGLPLNVTQTALTLAISFNLYAFSNSNDIIINNNTARTHAGDTLRQLIADNDHLVGTGFAGTQHLGFALSAIDATADMYKMLLQTRVPSWLFQVVMGATTSWERWDSLLADGSVNPGSMTSFNHYAFGSVANWVHATVAGLAPSHESGGGAETGWAVVEVRPVPGGGITWSKASYLGPYGLVEVKWWVEGPLPLPLALALAQNDHDGDAALATAPSGPNTPGAGQKVIVMKNMKTMNKVNETKKKGFGLYLQVSVPPNSRARVTVPGSNQTEMVGSGFYEWFVDGFQVPS